MTSSLDMIRGRSNVVTLTNKSGGPLVAGDVCVIDTANDEAATTTTSAASVLKVYIAAEAIANNATGKFYSGGFCPLATPSASVTRGRYLFTHTVAKQCAESATYGSGAFGVILKSGTTPSVWLFGSTAQGSGGGVSRSGSTTDGHLAVWNGSNADSIKDGGVSGDMSWSVIQASQLVNEIKGFPASVPNDADLVTLNLWWDDVATPTTKATFVDVAGEAGLTATYQYALKCVGDGAGDGLQQTWTYADEPRLKSGRVMSALLAIWSVSSVSVTAKLVNSDASETAASAVTAAAWTIVEIPNHTLAGTSCSLQVTAGAAGTFYIVPLGANIGARAVALKPRGERYIDKFTSAVVSAVDPGGGSSYIDVDLTASTSPLATRALCTLQYQNVQRAASLFVRRNGSADASTGAEVVYTGAAGVIHMCQFIVELDDGNIFEYATNGQAGDTETVFISVRGYWEWE